MAGGFDGIADTVATLRRGEPHKAQASLIADSKKESTQGVDNLYKYLKIKVILLETSRIN